MAETARVIELKGNPNNPEQAEHIIIFPGGSISVTRTSSNEYWAHTEVNSGQIIPDTVRQSARGEVVKGRIDYNRPPGDVRHIEDVNELEHVAIRIKTTR